MMSFERKTGRGWDVPIPFSIVAGVTLALLQLLWYYVANVAVLSAATRSSAKEVLFWMGIIVLFAAAIRIAITATTRWVQRTLIGVSLVMLTSAVVSSTALLIIRGHLSANSALLGSSRPVTAVGAVLALALYVLLPLGPAVAAGYLGRRIRRSATN